eukprot:8103917-Pyramimonas_sp.AAC.1
MQDSRVYTHDGPIRCRNRGYIPTMDQSDVPRCCRTNRRTPPPLGRRCCPRRHPAAAQTAASTPPARGPITGESAGIYPYENQSQRRRPAAAQTRHRCGGTNCKSPGKTMDRYWHRRTRKMR